MGLKDEGITGHVERVRSLLGELARLWDKWQGGGMSEALRGWWCWRQCLCSRNFQVSVAGELRCDFSF